VCTFAPRVFAAAGFKTPDDHAVDPPSNPMRGNYFKAQGGVLFAEERVGAVDVRPVMPLSTGRPPSNKPATSIDSTPPSAANSA
jgi:hypothetical protein